MQEKKGKIFKEIGSTEGDMVNRGQNSRKGVKSKRDVGTEKPPEILTKKTSEDRERNQT